MPIIEIIVAALILGFALWHIIKMFRLKRSGCGCAGCDKSSGDCSACQGSIDFITKPSSPVDSSETPSQAKEK